MSGWFIWFILGEVRTGNHALEQVDGNSHRPEHVHAGTAKLARIQPLLTCTQPANYTHKRLQHTQTSIQRPLFQDNLSSLQCSDVVGWAAEGAFDL